MIFNVRILCNTCYQVYPIFSSPHIHHSQQLHNPKTFLLPRFQCLTQPGHALIRRYSLSFFLWLWLRFSSGSNRSNQLCCRFGWASTSWWFPHVTTTRELDLKLWPRDTWRARKTWPTTPRHVLSTLDVRMGGSSESR